MTWFCDWLTLRATLGGEHDVRGGTVLELAPDGSQRWASVKRLPVKGSYDATLQVRSSAGRLEVSGNPIKWFQGHNLWGSNDVHGLAVALVLDVCARVGWAPTPADLAAWDAGGIELSRVDVTRMYRCPAGSVRGWLSVMAAQTVQGHQRVTNPAPGDAGTVYVGQKSRRVSLKFYSKEHELARHGLALGVPSPSLLDYARDTLRVELVLRGMKLKDEGLRVTSEWDESSGDRMMQRQLEQLSMLDNLALADDELADLPPRLLPIYEAWRAGHDLTKLYSKAQFYRHRSALLPHGIDIRQVRPRIVREKEAYPLGAPLRSFLEAPLEPPSWAHGTPLLYQPRAS